jgi:hypothetical protein
MVCTVCGESLSRIEVHTPQSTAIPWSHWPDMRQRDHEVVVGMADSLTLPATARCDCCSAGRPVHLWLPGSDPAETVPVPADGTIDASWMTPWAACKPCSRLIAARDMDRLLRRWRALSGHPAYVVAAEEHRAAALLQPFPTSAPLGPYPVG